MSLCATWVYLCMCSLRKAKPSRPGEATLTVRAVQGRQSLAGQERLLIHEQMHARHAEPVWCRFVPVSRVLPEERFLFRPLSGAPGFHRAVARYGYVRMTDITSCATA